MVTDVLRTVRERLTVRHFLPHLAFVALLYGVTRNTELVVAVAIAMVLTETVAVLRETPSISDGWVQVGIGVFVTVGSLAWLWYELTVAADTGGPAWFPALMVLAGIWFLLDARTALSGGLSGTPDDEMDTNEVLLVMNHGHLVVEELKTGPKTVPELAERCDLTESRVRDVLDFATDDNMVYEVAGDTADTETRYALDESKVGGVAFLRSNARRVLGRLARPFRP